MRSRAARLTSSAVAWIAIFGAGVFLFNSEQQISSRRTALRAFDQHAREAAEALADIRAGQQAYVAAGQGVAFWVPRVAALVEQTSATVDALRASASSVAARQDLLEAAAAITELSNVDRRARDYIRAGEQLMAGDVVFTEGGEVATTAAHQVEASRLAEYRAFDAQETAQRRLEAFALAAAAGLSALILALFAFAPPVSVVEAASEAPAPAASTSGTDLSLHETAAPAPKAAANELPRGSVPALRAAASLCTEFGRVKDIADLTALLGRAAGLMDASGLIVWLGSASGSDLRPVLAHGYAEQTLARIPPVPRSADNAAAAAYRSGSLQIVMARPGTSPGAVVAPLLAADGCIGALTAEIRDRGETSDSVQALAAIFAAQLAGVLSGSVAPANNSAQGTAEASRAASA